jgi:pSer/pThr/pTyr-binding forkhead associated (FHA) protein
VLVRYRGALHVIDLSSVNGTFLNGKRLLPDVPYPVNSGDQLSLANLNLIITQIER